MGRVRRNGYILMWWVGDHAPRHIHVFDSNEELLGRITIDGLQPLDDWQPPKKVITTIQELIEEGRL
jgi:hypothetical protein